MKFFFLLLIFYRNFEIIFEFMVLKSVPHMWPKRLPFFIFCVFLYLIVIILTEENKKKLTICQNNEK